MTTCANLRSVCHVRMTTAELRECYTPEQAAEITQLSAETIRRRCRQGQYVMAANIGTAKRPQWRIHPSELGCTVPEVADTAAA